MKIKVTLDIRKEDDSPRVDREVLLEELAEVLGDLELIIPTEDGEGEAEYSVYEVDFPAK